MTVLGIDLGTQSVKVASVDVDGHVRASASRAYEVASPQPGWAEADPQAWWAAAMSAAEEVLAISDRPVAIGVSGQMHGVVLCDAMGDPLRPAITWADSRSTDQAARLSSELGPEQLARLGSAAFPGFAGPTLAWLHAHEPGIVERARWALQPKDWLRLKLTGQVATDPSDASGTMLYDVVAGHWSEEAVLACGVRPELLAPILSSRAPTGEAIDSLLEGIPVVVGGADAACGLVGLGLRAGQGAIAVGTGAQLTCVLDEPRPDKTLRTHTFSSAGDIGESWYRLAAVQSGGLALERALTWLGASTSEAQAALAEGITDSDPLFWPFVAGERSPYVDPDLRASWGGLSLSTTRPELLRSVMEGMAYAVGAAFEALCESGARPDVPVMCLGGGSRDPAYVRVLATVLDIPLQPAASGDATVVGAARLAAEGCGIDMAPVEVVGESVVRPAQDRMISERFARWRAGVSASRG